MNRIAGWIFRPSRQPLRIFVFLLAAVSSGEYGIMILLARVPPPYRGTMLEAAVDSFLLTTVLAPVLWLVVVRPLERLSSARGELLARVYEAQESERVRIARDLHDELGQHLTAVLIGLRNVQDAETLDQVRDRAKATSEAASTALGHVRRIARGLWPTVLEDLGLVPAVERLVEDFQTAHGVGVVLKVELDRGARFSPAVELCLFRVIQESLTNVARHAGAGTVEVTLGAADGKLCLSVHDDGCGFDPAVQNKGSLGLSGMRERVEYLEGRFRVESAPDHGTTISALLPSAASAP